MTSKLRSFGLMAVAAIALASPAVGQNEPGKRNARPQAPTAEKAVSKPAAFTATHTYEFTRPGFSYGRILIEHDDAGVGQILFLKDGFEEALTDPIKLSSLTLGKISAALAEMNFLDSTEDYQYERDYSHLGNITFTLRQGARSRTVKYNWTDHKGARALMDEYRRIGNECTWRFEILLARQNMPLQTPSLMETFEAYYRRGELSDPTGLAPFLTELSTDERLPLIARNKAAKVLKEISKK
jgi:hypothetical protein